MKVIDDVRSIIATSLEIPIERLTPDTRLDELGAESLKVIEILFEIEERFDISIPLKMDEGTQRTVSDKSDGDRMQFTVGDLTNIVKRLVEAKAYQ